MQEKKYSKKYWEREREREREITFLWRKTMQRIEKRMTNL